MYDESKSPGEQSVKPLRANITLPREAGRVSNDEYRSPDGTLPLIESAITYPEPLDANTFFRILTQIVQSRFVTPETEIVIQTDPDRTFRFAGFQLHERKVTILLKENDGAGAEGTD